MVFSYCWCGMDWLVDSSSILFGMDWQADSSSILFGMDWQSDSSSILFGMDCRADSSSSVGNFVSFDPIGIPITYCVCVVSWRCKTFFFICMYVCNSFLVCLLICICALLCVCTAMLHALPTAWLRWLRSSTTSSPLWRDS